VTAQGNTVTDEKIIAVLSLSSSAASASLGALSFVTWPTSYSVRRKGCATPLVPDGPMVSSSSDLSVISPSPGAPLCRGFFLVGFGRPWEDAAILAKLDNIPLRTPWLFTTPEPWASSRIEYLLDRLLILFEAHAQPIQ
jgi:hypothetical protein